MKKLSAIAAAIAFLAAYLAQPVSSYAERAVSGRHSATEVAMLQATPAPGVPKPPPPKGPITNGNKPGQKPDPDKGQKPDKAKPKGNGHKPDKGKKGKN